MIEAEQAWNAVSNWLPYCIEIYVLAWEVPRSKWYTPSKVVENNQAQILWDFQIQIDKLVITNQRERGSSDRCSHPK